MLTQQDLIVKIKRREELTKEIKALDNFLQFYEDEVRELTNIMHKTGEGELMLVSEMTDDHLINTYNLCSGKGYGVGKYKAEIKRRGLADRVINPVARLESPFNHRDEDDDDEDGIGDIF